MTGYISSVSIMDLAVVGCDGRRGGARYRPLRDLAISGATANIQSRLLAVMCIAVAFVLCDRCRFI